MNPYDRRIARLENQAEAATTLENCSCANRPAVAVTIEDASRGETSDAALAALAFECLVHGQVGPVHRVAIVDPTIRAVAPGAIH